MLLSLTGVCWLMKKILSFLQKPFGPHLSFLLLLWMLAVAGQVWTIAFFHGNLYFACCWLALGLLMSYVCTLFVPRSGARVYKGILLLLGVLNLVTDVSCGLVMRTFYFDEYAGIILNTHLSEAVEFVQSFLPLSLFLYLLLALLLLVAGVRVAAGLLSGSRWTSRVGLFLLGLTLAVTVAGDKWTYFGNIFLGKFYTLYAVARQLPPDLRTFYSSPPLVADQSQAPQEVVLIIGESFARSHSSLYGYDKQTNPRLEELYRSGSLHLFRQVEASAHNTIPNFQCLMSTYRLRGECADAWYECLTLPEVLSLSGVASCWVSNQGKNGLFDNVPARYAALCDTAVFVGNRFDSFLTASYDEEVIPPLKSILSHEVPHRLSVVHLMGSHAYFEKRYPPSRARFLPSDYADSLPHQREELARYDNSILYNDSVVAELISLFRHRDAVVFYFPDHGLDAYVTRPDYIGHALPDSPASLSEGLRIPFMIYTSPLYEARCPQQVGRIRRSVSVPFVTEDLLYTVMDLLGIRFRDHHSVERYSLFRPLAPLS